MNTKTSKNVDSGDGKQAQKVWKISTREKEISGYKGQPKTDLEATNPQVLHSLASR